MATGTAVGPPAAEDHRARDDVEQEFLQEDQRLLLPMLGRIDELAEHLDRGESVDPACLSQGIELWSRYDAEIDARRVGRVLALLPETTPQLGAGGPARGRFRGSGRAPSAGAASHESSLREYQEIVHEQRTATDRMNGLRSLVELYAQGAQGTRQRLALAMKGFTAAERAWARYEEEFVLKGSELRVSAETDDRVHRALAEVSAASARLQAEVAAYLARPVLFRTEPVPEGTPAP